MTRNLVLELKYIILSIKINKKKLIATCPVRQATEIFACPNE